MPDRREPRSVVQAAEQAAAAGDYELAEQLLREAADLLEEGLGPFHPDLANALNNLGVVCEITEKPVDAEHYFRRAYAIVAASLAPDHPFVAMSRKNLEDFCSARGKAVDESIVDDLDVPVAALEEFPPERSLPDRAEMPFLRPAEGQEESRPAGSSGRKSRPLAVGALIAGGLLLSAFAAVTWFRSNEEIEAPSASPSVQAESPAATPEPPVAEAIAPARTQESATNQDDTRSNPDTNVKAELPPAAPVATDAPGEPRGTTMPKEPGATTIGENSTAGASAAQPSVVAAQLCRDLSTSGSRGEWECLPPNVPADPGSLFFYTRLKSPADTTIQHRWYRGDRLRKVVDLVVRANTMGGYRTYSRQTVDNEAAGDWRVELRTIDGVLLHEERFTVR